MITVEKMMTIDKGNLQEASKKLSGDEILQLVKWLSVKDNHIRYQAFLLLQNRSIFFQDVYPYWNTFRDKLSSENSYQRSIGLMLLAENARWDVENRTGVTIDEYLECLNDEKPITVRQCIQSLGKIALFKPELNHKIAKRLIFFDLMAIKETMRKSILLDILNVLLILRKNLKSDKIEGFFLSALSGEILDKKSKRQIETML